jgi:hypothetical protein
VAGRPVRQDRRAQWAISEFTTGHWITVQREPRQFPI